MPKKYTYTTTGTTAIGKTQAAAIMKKIWNLDAQRPSITPAICQPQPGDFPAGKLPWHEHPWRLISWLEMNKYGAKQFYQMGVELGNLIQALNSKQAMAEGISAVVANASAGNLALPQLTYPALQPKALCYSIAAIQHNSEEIGLIQSVQCAEDLLDDLSGKGASKRGLTDTGLRFRLDELRRLIANEMGSQLFFRVRSNRKDDYEQPKPYFGEMVSQTFTSAAYDIAEAGKWVVS